MRDRTRQQRVGDAASGLRKLSSEEEARLRSVALRYALVSFVVQGLLLVVGVRTVRTMYGARHLGPRPVLRAAGGPLLGLLALGLTQIAVDRRLRRWVMGLIDTPPD